MNYFIAQACRNLRPMAGVSVDENGVQWHNIETADIPTEAEIQAETARLQADYESTAYQRQRQPEYPSLAELADALYWASTGDTTKLDAYYAACGAVKAKYPKPEVTP